jgi:hypothetical protein
MLDSHLIFILIVSYYTLCLISLIMYYMYYIIIYVVISISNIVVRWVSNKLGSVYTIIIPIKHSDLVCYSE